MAAKLKLMMEIYFWMLVNTPCTNLRGPVLEWEGDFASLETDDEILAYRNGNI